MAAEINGIINSMIEISVVTQDAFTVLRDVFRADRALLVEMGRWEIQSQVRGNHETEQDQVNVPCHSTKIRQLNKN